MTDSNTVCIFRTISEDPDREVQHEEFHGVYGDYYSAVKAARTWAELTLKELDDPDATVTEHHVVKNQHFVFMVRDYQGDWIHKAIVKKEELL